MKRIIEILFGLLLLLPLQLYAQDFIFFSDSPINMYYDPSWGYSINGSVVVLTGGKIPVDADIKFTGTNALRIRWKSVEGGDWGASVGETGLPVHDVTKMDSLIFHAYSSADIDSSGIPLICLEDLLGRKTNKKKISGYINRIDKGRWVRISIPLDIFTSSKDSADMTTIKAVSFSQSSPDGTLRTIYLDEIRMISNATRDTAAPKAPAGLSAKGNSVNIKLSWQPNQETDLAGYRIYRQDTGAYKVIGNAKKSDSSYNDYTGIPPKSFVYKISAFDLSGNESALSTEASASTASLSDSLLLDMVQQATFKYFWDYAHPVSGLARDRLGGGDVVTSGGSGFGVMAILVGIERGFITRTAGIARMLQILNFLSLNADRFHGAYSHVLNGSTGHVIPFSQKDDGGDLVETAFLIQGLLTARQFFNQTNTDEEKIRNIITSIWQGVEWDWYRKDANSNYLYWHWSPNYGWSMNFQLKGWNETMITYLLAIASPTHKIPASLYKLGWAGDPNYKNGKNFYGIPLEVGWDYGGPLFFTHYSFLGFDPRNKKDAYTNYFINNRNTALIHQAYCKANPKNFPGYDADTWGLTASDDPITGYMAHEPNNDNGTISPTAALSSMPYTPKESMDALRSFYYEYGLNLWGTYGFKDAFNLKEGWYANSYLAIDQGPIIVMIENYRSGLLWNYFMANAEIKPMLDSIGFVPDTLATTVKNESYNLTSCNLMGNYPNPFNPSTTIKFSIPTEQAVLITVYDMLGKTIKTLANDRLNAGVHDVRWDGRDNLMREVSSGIYLYTIKAENKMLTGKMLLQK